MSRDGQKTHRNIASTNGKKHAVKLKLALLLSGALVLAGLLSSLSNEEWIAQPGHIVLPIAGLLLITFLGFYVSSTRTSGRQQDPPE
jgi:hypothetical protein